MYLPLKLWFSILTRWTRIGLYAVRMPPWTDPAQTPVDLIWLVGASPDPSGRLTLQPVGVPNYLAFLKLESIRICCV